MNDVQSDVMCNPGLKIIFVQDDNDDALQGEKH